jgi:hypothetical protein
MGPWSPFKAIRAYPGLSGGAPGIMSRDPVKYSFMALTDETVQNAWPTDKPDSLGDLCR